jgi:hypothetical protein
MSMSGRVFAITVLALVLAPAAAAEAQQLVNAGIREGIYADSDHTQVYRSLLSAQAAMKRFTLSVQEEIDVLTSASVDVRSSPFLDAVTGASVTAPHMSDQRFETNLAGGWNDGQGHAAAVSAVYAHERDYDSVGGGVTTSWDFFERNTTLLGGINGSHNVVTSIADRTFSRTLAALGYSLGVAQVITPRDALRVRYDGAYLDGYQASPYRAVRFGNWTTALRPGGDGLLFLNTMGPADGLPEKLPGSRTRHAGTLEWVHALNSRVALSGSYRLAYDDWGVLANTLGAELRGMRKRWQGRIGYRFYWQGSADFYQEKYVLGPDAYRSYTSDKELGEVHGHSGSADVGYTLLAPRPGRRIEGVLDAKVEYLYYQYPDFALLSDRSSVFGEVGFRMSF